MFDVGSNGLQVHNATYSTDMRFHSDEDVNREANDVFKDELPNPNIPFRE